MPATEPIYKVDVNSLPAGGENVTVVGPLDGSGNVKVSVQSAPGSQTVIGPDASGTPPTAAPVLFAGQDGTDVRTVLVDTSGRPIVSVNGTVTVSVSGTPNVNVMGVPQVQGSVAAGSALADNPVQVAGSDGTDVRRVLVDTSGRVIVNVNGTVTTSISGTPTVAVGSVSPPAAVVSGHTTIATGGTAVQLANHALTAGLVAIYALAGNAGKVYVGPSSVTSSTGIELTAGSALVCYVSNTNALYVNGPNVGDGISWVAS